MTLRRRLMLLLLLATPVVWIGGLLISFLIARHEINELFDAELVRLGQQMIASLPASGGEGPPSANAGEDEADLKDLLVAVWDHDGHLLRADREGQSLPYKPEQLGFADLDLQGRPWRGYYLHSMSGQWVVAVGQRVEERRKVIRSLSLGPLVPWVLVLPVLLGVMALGLRRVLAPVTRLSVELESRAAGDLHPLSGDQLPADLLPLVHAMNAQFARTESLLQRERRFTADAAHELRTPLAALQAQWDAARLTGGAESQPEALAKVGQGLARLSRLVTQMLQLARVEHLDGTVSATLIDWSPLVGEVFTEVLPLAERCRVELACEWPPTLAERFPLYGDAALLAALLRNLLDNALRHSPAGGQVSLRFEIDTLEVLDDGPGVPPEQLARLGDRFYRPPGQTEPGSGLGLSIVRRIAALHDLAVSWGPRDDAPGFCVRLQRLTPRSPPT